MAKTMKKYRKRTGSRKKKMRGGFPTPTNVAATSASFQQGPGAEGAAPYVEAKYGTTNQQYNDVFDIGSKTLGNSFTKLPESQIPSNQSLQLIQSAGKRRRYKKKKGGMGALQSAAVPLGLLVAHNRLSKRKGRKSKKGGKKMKKSRKHRKTKKGGMLGQIMSTAAVPFGLLGAHNMFGKKAKKGKKSKKFFK